MNQDTIQKLNTFQNILKQCIQDRFKSVLSQEKINILNNTNFINVDELKQYNNPKEIQGIILRNMLKSIINITCKKQLPINNTTKLLDYGKLLEDIVVEYFAIDISKKYKFDILENSNLVSNFTIINDIKNMLSDNFDDMMINHSAIEILSVDGLKDMESIFDVSAINEYTTKEEKTVLQSIAPSNNIEVPTTGNNTVDITKFITPEKQNNSSESELSQEEYEELCMKYARNEPLTPDEYRALLKATPDLMPENQIESLVSSQNEQKLELNHTGGFSYIKMTLYFIVITTILGFIIATLLINY